MRCAMQPVTPISDIGTFLLYAGELTHTPDHALLCVLAIAHVYSPG